MVPVRELVFPFGQSVQVPFSEVLYCHLYEVAPVAPMVKLNVSPTPAVTLVGCVVMRRGALTVTGSVADTPLPSLAVTVI